MQVVKDVQARGSRWAITDTALCPGQRHLAYASITPVVHVVGINSWGPVHSLANVTEVRHVRSAYGMSCMATLCCPLHCGLMQSLTDVTGLWHIGREWWYAQNRLTTWFQTWFQTPL